MQPSHLSRPSPLIAPHTAIDPAHHLVNGSADHTHQQYDQICECAIRCYRKILGRILGLCAVMITARFVDQGHAHTFQPLDLFRSFAQLELLPSAGEVK